VPTIQAKMEPVKRRVTASMKKEVAGRQRYTCAANVDGYTCPLGSSPFDEAGFEIDHIVELRNGGTNDLSNLQALCLMCHRVKTTRKSRETPPKVSKPREKKVVTPPEEPITYWEPGMFKWKGSAMNLPAKVAWKTGTNSIEFMQTMQALAHLYRYDETNKVYIRK
jgi:hypothetical protein